MPEKHPNTQRWGGPGASHEDATKSPPELPPARPEGPDVTNPRVSQVSGGGGEPDEKHSHVDRMRSAKSHATDSPSPTSPRTWRRNRSRSDIARERQRQAEAMPDAPASGEAEEAAEASGPPGSERGLQVLVNTDSNLPGTESVAGQVEQAVRKGLRRFEAQLTRVQVFLADENAAKGGPADKRCTIEARPRGAAPVAASDRGETIDGAVSAALSRLTAALNTELGRRRDHKGGDSVRNAPR